jgi:hypothetical protein
MPLILLPPLVLSIMSMWNLYILLQFSGAMTDTEAAEELGDFGVVSSLDVAIMFVLRYCHAV